MATVWLARLRGEYGFDRHVAIKTILPPLAGEPHFRDMFLDEACIASLIQHPNVAQILDLGERDGRLYMVMEWVDGDSLSNLIHATAAHDCAVPLPILLRILADACGGLHAAHELRDARGHKLEVVHRDVSPQNILVSHTGAVKVIDFGVLQARGRLVEETLAGIVKGKLCYVAPERALGGTVDCRADVWAMGAILYRTLGGRPVYDGEGNLAIVRQLMGENQLRPLPRSVPRMLRHIVDKALARDPNQRYGTMAELQRELEGQLHQFASATTTQDVAGFVASVLGPSLAERRAAINRAVERQDETATLRFPNQAYMALVPAVTPREATADEPRHPSPDTRRAPGNSAKPALKLVREPDPREVRLRSVLATTQRRRPPPRPVKSSRTELARLLVGSRSELARLLVCGALTFVVGLLAATLHSSLGSNVSQPSNVAAPSAQLPAPPVARAQSSAPAPLQPRSIVNVNDLPIERSVSDGIRPGASQRRFDHGSSRRSIEVATRVPK